MLPYWGLLIALGVASLFKQIMGVAPQEGRLAVRQQGANLPILTFGLALIAMIGLRYEVGGDWETYLTQYNTISRSDLNALEGLYSELGYTLLNWLASRLGLGVWFVNTLCAVPFVVGLVLIARQQRNPWLVFVVATPVLIILVGMGYTRQSVGVGCMLIGLAGLIKGRRFAWFVCWVLVGALFHKSVLIFIPIIALFAFEWSFKSLLLLMTAVLIAYFIVIPQALDRYSAGYINTVYEAKGVLFRVVPNALAGIILLSLGKRFSGPRVEMRIWRGFAILSILALGSLWFVQSSVIVDRMSLYILPMQVIVLANLPFALAGRDRDAVFLSTLVIAFTAIQLFIWLNYANHSRLWIPYQFYPFAS